MPLIGAFHAITPSGRCRLISLAESRQPADTMTPSSQEAAADIAAVSPLVFATVFILH